MKLSQLFTKTKRQAPAGEVARNAQLLIRAGFIHKDAAGVYAVLPLGLKVLHKIEVIIRAEMEALGGQELAMTSLQRRELWAKTDRWDDQQVDIWFKTHYQNGTEAGLAWSHEEPIVDLAREFIASYRDLPASVFQFQTKLRNELRAKSGLLRTREFVMKDMYSFASSDQQHDAFYDRVKAAYLRIFEQVGLGERTFITYASGGAFTQFSHEFQTLCDAGEDTIHLDRQKRLAVNQEVMTPEVLGQLGLKSDELEEVTAAEVGNIFSFGTTKSQPLGLNFTDEAGEIRPVILGSYGIGLGRLMGVIVECLADDQGLVWPAAVAPADVHLVALGDSRPVRRAADELYDRLIASGQEVIYDDRDESAGAKFADADLMGVPLRVTVSAKTLDHQEVELKPRTSDQTEMVKISSFKG
jgi:prolyl-tRNA synthetase